MNIELFGKIDEVISPRPGRIDSLAFNMDSWEDDSYSCGTTRCVAGWAIYFATGEASVYDRSGRHSNSVLELAGSLGTWLYDTDDAYEADLEDLAAKLLGLSRQERRLFYTSEEVAAEFVHLAAQGKLDEAREVLDR